MVPSRPWTGGILGGHVFLQLFGLNCRPVRPYLGLALCCGCRCSCFRFLFVLFWMAL